MEYTKQELEFFRADSLRVFTACLEAWQDAKKAAYIDEMYEAWAKKWRIPTEIVNALDSLGWSESSLYC